MDLWIRNQDRMKLTKVDTIELCEKVDGTWFLNAGDNLGTYETKERAIEVLDEIQAMIQQKYLVQLKEKYPRETVEAITETYKGYKIADAGYEIKPFGKGATIYEMPTE